MTEIGQKPQAGGALCVLSTSFAKSAPLRHKLRATLDPAITISYPGDTLKLAPGTMLSGADIVASCKDAAALLVGRELIDAKVLAGLPKLNAIAKYGVGLDNLDQDAMAAQGVRLLWQAGVNAPHVAEHALGLILALSRNIAIGSQRLHQGQWHKDGGRSIYGAKVAIIGLGHTGAATARLLKLGFGCQIAAFDIIDKSALCQQEGYACASSLDEAITGATIVSLHVPLTAKTLNMVDGGFLHKLSPGAMVINTSRGEVVDQAALVAALTGGVIAGAGLDVFWREPEIDGPLMSHPAVVATPHTAGNSQQAIAAMGEAAIAGLAEWYAGRQKS